MGRAHFLLHPNCPYGLLVLFLGFWFVVSNMQLLRNTYFGVNTNAEHRMEHLVRTVEHILKLPDYATMLVCVGFRYLRGGFDLGGSVINSRHDMNTRGWLWCVNW